MEKIESISIKRILPIGGSFGCGCQCGGGAENKSSNMSGAATACRCICTDGQSTALADGQSADK
ncbi:MAG: hypothetical protein MUF15_15600 [Acidobacteria bacterium]|jgi:hypothetical protein|nr:hypothetical protein [Acidobacteriota bacterium]